VLCLVHWYLKHLTHSLYLVITQYVRWMNGWLDNQMNDFLSGEWGQLILAWLKWTWGTTCLSLETACFLLSFLYPERWYWSTLPPKKAQMVRTLTSNQYIDYSSCELECLYFVPVFFFNRLVWQSILVKLILF
jgi:hypothetical protein